MKRAQTLAASAVLASALALGAAAPASATDYNVSAVTNTNFATSVPVTLAPGDYTLTAIGTAQGGLYDAWNPNSQAGCENACSTQWRWVYSYFNSPTTIQIVGIGAQFGTASAANAAMQASPTFLFNLFNTTTSVVTVGSVPNPFQFTIGAPTTFGVFLSDSDGDTANNLGGVSFRITAVPEPATWAMLIMGFGLMGVAMRRRRALANA